MYKTRTRETTSREEDQEPSQVVGFRVPAHVAREVKAEAGRRGIKLNELFIELWGKYKQQHPEARQ